MLTRLEYSMLATSATDVINAVATTQDLGKVKVGSNLSITQDGTLSADAAPYTLPAATTEVLGGVKVGDNLTVAQDGTLSAAAPYELPAATEQTLGGVKVGTGLAVAQDGTLSTVAGAPSFVRSRFVADGIADAFGPINSFVDDITKIMVFVDGIEQEPVETWGPDANNQRIQFNEAPPAGVVVRVVVISA